MPTSAGLRNIERLFERFEKLYGTRFTDMWSNDPAGVKRAWAAELAGYTTDEVRAGLSACKTRPWPPTLPEFLLLCRPAPDYEKLFAEAQIQISRRDRGEDEWTSKSVYWAAVEFGFHDLRSMSWATAKTRWTRICCEKRAQEDGLPDIPAARQAYRLREKAKRTGRRQKHTLQTSNTILGGIMLEQILADKSLTLEKLAERLSMTVEETKQFVKEMRQKGYPIRLWMPVD